MYVLTNNQNQYLCNFVRVVFPRKVYKMFTNNKNAAIKFSDLQDAKSTAKRLGCEVVSCG